MGKVDVFVYMGKSVPTLNGGRNCHSGRMRTSGFYTRLGAMPGAGKRTVLRRRQEKKLTRWVMCRPSLYGVQRNVIGSSKAGPAGIGGHGVFGARVETGYWNWCFLCFSHV